MPFPKAFDGMSPKSLLHATVSWMYSVWHPARIASDARDITPNSMDECYTDEWIMEEMVSGLREDIKELRHSFQMGCFSYPIQQEHPWVQSAITIEPASLLE